MDENILHNCHDCGVKPGQVHKDGCDVERCTVCAGQRLTCSCPGHDKVFARWTGIWPGKAEADFLRMDLNEFNSRDISHFHLGARTPAELFFRKPVSRTPDGPLTATCAACKHCFVADEHRNFPGIELDGRAGYGSEHDGDYAKAFICDACIKAGRIRLSEEKI